MKNMILAVIFAAAPAAAQTTVRVPVSGVNALPGLGASFDATRLGAAPLPMPTLSPGMQMPALSALALIPTLAPTLVQPAPAAGIPAAAARPVEGSPLGVIRDASANEAQKTAALDRFFENSAPSSPETPDLKRPSSWDSLSPAVARPYHAPSLSAIKNLPSLAAPRAIPKAALSFDSIFQNDPSVRRLEAIRAETQASDLNDDAKAEIYAGIDETLHAIRVNALNQHSVEKRRLGRLLRWINAATAYFASAGIVDRYESWRASRAMTAATKTAIAEGKMIQFNGQTFPVVSFPKKGDESLLVKLIAAAKVSIDFSDGDAISPELRKALDQAGARGVVVRFNQHLSARDHIQFSILDGKITGMDQGQNYFLTTDPEWLSYWANLYRPNK